MGFKEKAKSGIVEKAENRLSGMQVVDGSQDKPVNYGSEKGPLTVQEMTAQINLVEAKRAEYNKTLKTADEISNEYDAEETKLNELCKKVLSNAVGIFGDDSDEYEQLGGTRKSDRKKPVRQPKAPK